MYLLTSDGDVGFRLISFTGTSIPPYAILSHTWGPDAEEVTFSDMIDGSGTQKRGYQKVRRCGQQAYEDGLNYFWVDSCCIDQTSSAELSTAINSMYRWYQNAVKCYVYMADLLISSTSEEWESSFLRSRWFTLLDHGVNKGTNASPNPHSDFITMLEIHRWLLYETDTLRRTCHDNGPRQEGSTLREESDGLADIENLVPTMHVRLSN